MTSPTNERCIVWLHLSDLHYCKKKTHWDMHRVLEPLIRDLKRMERDHGLVPQLLFFTGDGAFGNIGNVAGSTLREQFDGVQAFLESVRAAFSSPIPHKNVFIVPGNHDVDRGEVTPDETQWLTEKDRNPEEMTNLIHEANRQWEKFMDRLKAYRDFLDRNGYQHLLGDSKRLIYSQTREIHGLNLGIAGFNSAWSCCQSREKGQLWIAGDWQSGTLVQNLRGADVRLALTHHPFGWFVEQEDTAFRIRFEREFSFHLHGHEHLGWVNKNDHHVRVAAAACYESSWTKNGYNFVRLNLETGKGEVWLRQYETLGGEWIPRVVAKKTNNDGQWLLGQLDCLQSFVKKPIRKSSTEPSGSSQHSSVNLDSNTPNPLPYEYAKNITVKFNKPILYSLLLILLIIAISILLISLNKNDNNKLSFKQVDPFSENKGFPYETINTIAAEGPLDDQPVAQNDLKIYRKNITDNPGHLYYISSKINHNYLYYLLSKKNSITISTNNSIIDAIIFVYIIKDENNQIINKKGISKKICFNIQNNITDDFYILVVLFPLNKEEADTAKSFNDKPESFIDISQAYGEECHE